MERYPLPRGTSFGIAARITRAAAGFYGLGLSLGSWDIEDVELAAGGWLHDMLVGGVVRDMVPIHDVVVPVSLPLLHSATLEAKGPGP